MKYLNIILPLCVAIIAISVGCSATLFDENTAIDNNGNAITPITYTISQNTSGFESYRKEINEIAGIYNVEPSKIYVYKIWYQKENLQVSYKTGTDAITVYSLCDHPWHTDDGWFIKGIDETIYTRFTIIKPIR